MYYYFIMRDNLIFQVVGPRCRGVLPLLRHFQDFGGGSISTRDFNQQCCVDDSYDGVEHDSCLQSDYLFHGLS